MNTKKTTTNRRKFLGSIAGSAATIGMLTIPASIKAANPLFEPVSDLDQWFNQIKGKHRVVFDATRPHNIFPFAWPRVFLLTNQATGTPEKENSVVVVLRHDAIPYAFEDRLWAKYKLGEVFKAEDPASKAPSLRNPFAKPAPDEYKIPGFGAIQIGINELQNSGVLFAVCDAAITVYSAAVAQGMNMDAATVRKDWVSGLLPGIQVVPSGVWAIGRAQEHGCAYIFAG